MYDVDVDNGDGAYEGRVHGNTHGVVTMGVSPNTWIKDQGLRIQRTKAKQGRAR